MATKESRKELARQFKERKARAGIYAVRCTEGDRSWVGASPNLDATKNGCWFMLRGGLHQAKSLQAEWNARGEAAFEYEVVEVLDEDVHPLELAELLKACRAKWVAQLNAQPLL